MQVLFSWVAHLHRNATVIPDNEQGILWRIQNELLSVMYCQNIRHYETFAVSLQCHNNRKSLCYYAVRVICIAVTAGLAIK